MAQRVAVLGGASGATAALQRFISCIPPAPGVTFLVSLRVGIATAHRLADLLQRHSVLPVRLAVDGEPLYDNEVVILPADRELYFSPQRQLQLRACGEEFCIANPLDQTLGLVAQYFQRNAGALIFSGIGDDGIAGCRAIEQHGGEIWIQDPASAQFRGLPEQVAEACHVTFSASPEGLAERLAAELALLAQRGVRRIARR